MFSKPLSFILVYLLSLLNFLIITIPFLLIFSPLLLFGSDGFLIAVRDFIIFSLFVISALMVTYLTFDLLLGVSIWGMTRGHQPVQKMKKELPVLEKVSEDFTELNKKFRVPNTHLLIAKTPEVNAYAIGSFRRNVVVLTIGILAHYKRKSESMEEFYDSIRGIMAHEFSHLANRDFLPGLLVFANEKAVNFMAGLLRFFFIFIARFFTLIPFLGRVVFSLVMSLHVLTDRALTGFYRFLFKPIYNFVKLHVSRATEYRCDKQAAEACGGQEMATALGGLGESGFVTIFSTHPATKARVRYVNDIKKKYGTIRISILNRLSNLLAIIFLIMMLKVSYGHLSGLEYFSREFYYIIYHEKKSYVESKYEAVLKKINNLKNFRF